MFLRLFQLPNYCRCCYGVFGRGDGFIPVVQQEVSVLLGDEAGSLHMLRGDIKEEREVCVVALDLFLEVCPLTPTYRNLCQGFVVNMDFLHLLQYVIFSLEDVSISCVLLHCNHFIPHVKGSLGHTGSTMMILDLEQDSLQHNMVGRKLGEGHLVEERSNPR